MNTKFFFLLLVSLLVSTSTSSIANAKKEVNNYAPTQTEKAKQAKELSDQEPVSWTNHLAEENKTSGNEHKPSEDDGKFHHIHFNRVPETRRRRLVVFISKFFLAIIHACCFIYCFLHVFH